MEATKQDILKLIERMPDDASVEDIIYELYLRATVEKGQEDIRQDRTLSHSEVMEDIREWLQSAGR